MQVDRGSLLLGFVLGLAVATLLMASTVLLSTGQAFSGSSTAVAGAGATLTPSAGTPGRVGPLATQTATPTPTPTPTPTALPTPTPTVVPQATPAAAPALRYQSVDVAPRRFEVVQIPAEAGQTLELTLQIDSDVDFTLFNPAGEPVVGPLRVQRTYSVRQPSASGGSWAVKLDNSFSWITTKQVLLQYRLISP